MSTANPYDAAVKAELRKREHSVSISTRYGDTERECYCSATGGQWHDESDSPWLSPKQEDALTPQQRAQARVAWRMHEFLSEGGSEELLDALPKRRCAKHDDKQPGYVHWWVYKWPRAGGTHDFVTICIPEEKS